MTEHAGTGAQFAVIGMACRLPGASTPDELWENLTRGVESISFFDENGAETSTPPAPVASGVVRACGVIQDPAGFDAAFFGFSPREATLLDPQQRVFLECAHEALEHAGYDASRYKGAIAIYAGGSETSYLATLRAHRAELGGVDDWQLRLGTGVDFLTSRVSYKLGLRGPAVTVQTACSTSLVAIHLAAQSLLAGDCDMALAGGASLHVPTSFGHYTEGGVLSPDGRCRAFDEAAGGTVGSDGVAIVLLKRLEDALADGDNVYAVLCGSAINNDATAKVGFTAPSVEGQAQVVRTALAVAGFDPGTVTYVEAHGTGTHLGDPVEVAALTRAFGETPPGHCLLGSIKTNIGHTDAAAGAAGFIKTVLALWHRKLPPSLHYERPNPRIDFDASPFSVNTVLRDWTSDGPLRAGVSSLGIGGTNAHAVLEETPDRGVDRRPRAPELLVVSARSPRALAHAALRLGKHLAKHPTPVADVAWTLQRGRQAHPYRHFVVCEDAEGAVTALAEAELSSAPAPASPPRVAFMFPGHGDQHVGMGAELYRSQSAFRETIDRCSAVLATELGFELQGALYPAPDDPAAVELATSRLADITVGQLALFAVEAALGRMWERWGVAPDVVIGHSLGAYAAATIAGVLTLEGALDLVLARGRILASLPEGGMLAVRLSEEELAPLLADGVSIAAINGARRCTVAGTVEAVEALHRTLGARGVEARVLRIPRAGHSSIVDSRLAELAGAVLAVERRPPRIPWVSEITGRLVSAEEAVDPAYWTNHLRNTVRFADALGVVLDDPSVVLLEVGPGRNLLPWARQHASYRGQVAASTLPHPSTPGSDVASALAAAGRLWVAGKPIEWRHLHDGRRYRRVPLPTYPFERERCLVGAIAPAPSAPSAEPPAPAAFSAGDLGEHERRVAALFAEVVGLPHVGLHANFFEIGGDSLTAAQLAARTREAFDVKLQTKAIFRAPTPSKLARVVFDARTVEGGSRQNE